MTCFTRPPGGARRRRPLAPALASACLGCLAGVVAPLPALAAPTTAMPEVTITAKGDALAEQRAAASQKTVLDRAEIESLGGLTVGEVIRKLPGVDAGEHSGDGGMSARSRGMVRDSVQFLVNGERPTANARFAFTQIGRMPTEELERIEILRGASAEFGGAAPVTVNLVMRRPLANAASSLKAAIGQRGDQPNGQFTFSRSGGGDGFTWLLPLTVNHHGMPVEQTLVRAGTPLPTQREEERGDYQIDELIVSPRLAWKDGANSFTLWPSVYRNDGKRATLIDNDVAGQRRDSESSATRISRLRAESEQRIGSGKLSARAAMMDGRREADRERRPASAAVWQEIERRQDGELSASLRYDLPLGADDAHYFSVGLDAARHRREDGQWFTGGLSSASNFIGRERQWSAWLQDEWRAQPDLTLTAGLRGETMSLSANNATRRHGAVTPSLALKWEAAPGWVARLSSGGAIRFPKLEELTSVTSRAASANSPLEPDRGGNPALRPERIVNLEAGLDRNLAEEAGVIGVNLYLRRTRDFVERRQALEAARWVDRPENAGLARHWGMEWSAKLRGTALPWLPPSASLRANLTLPRGEVDDQRLGLRRAVRDMPSHTASLGYEQSLTSWPVSFGFQLQRSGTTRSRVADELVADSKSRNLLDVHLVRRLDASFNLRLAVQNLLGADTRRYATAIDGADAWSLDTAERGQRTWLLSLEGKW